MKLYHYHSTPLDSLLTKRKQGILEPQEITITEEEATRLQLPGAYIDHISFFIDPIPAKLLGELFGDFHQYWFTGNTIIEHVVDTDDLEAQITYRIVETPDKLQYLDSLDIADDHSDWLQEYYIGLNKIQAQNGELGTMRSGLEKQIERFVGRTDFFYQEARKRPDWEENKSKYAACVPHVMLYPAQGMIPVRERYRITIGDDTRIPIDVLRAFN